MQDGDDLLFLGVDARHDPQWVEDIGFSVPALLAGVGFDGDLNGDVE